MCANSGPEYLEAKARMVPGTIDPGRDWFETGTVDSRTVRNREYERSRYCTHVFDDVDLYAACRREPTTSDARRLPSEIYLLQRRRRQMRRCKRSPSRHWSLFPACDLPAVTACRSQNHHHQVVYKCVLSCLQKILLSDGILCPLLWFVISAASYR